MNNWISLKFLCLVFVCFLVVEIVSIVSWFSFYYDFLSLKKNQRYFIVSIDTTKWSWNQSNLFIRPPCIFSTPRHLKSFQVNKQHNYMWSRLYFYGEEEKEKEREKKHKKTWVVSLHYHEHNQPRTTITMYTWWCAWLWWPVMVATNYPHNVYIKKPYLSWTLISTWNIL